MKQNLKTPRNDLQQLHFAAVESIDSCIKGIRKMVIKRLLSVPGMAANAAFYAKVAGDTSGDDISVGGCHTEHSATIDIDINSVATAKLTYYKQVNIYNIHVELNGAPDKDNWINDETAEVVWDLAIKSTISFNKSDTIDVKARDLDVWVDGIKKAAGMNRLLS